MGDGGRGERVPNMKGGGGGGPTKNAKIKKGGLLFGTGK